MAKKKSKKSAVKARGTRISVKLSEVRPNPWNPNEQSPFVRGKMHRSLRRFGIVKETLVREVGPDKAAGEGNASVAGYEIIDGEHRYEELQGGNIDEMEVRNLGTVTDSEAKQLTVVLNEIKGDPNPRKLSELFNVLDSVGLRGEMSDIMPYTEDEIDAILKVRSLKPEEESSGPAGKRPMPKYMFQIGPHKAQLPDELGERIDAVYQQLAADSMTSDPVVVVTALCGLLEDCTS